MMAHSNPLSTPSGYWRLIPARHNGNPCYYHDGRNLLAWEDPQEGRLVALPADVERSIRITLALRLQPSPSPQELSDAIGRLEARMSRTEATVEAHSAVLAFGLGPEVD